jgi:hypothetical protein
MSLIVCMSHVSYHMYGSCLLSYVRVMSLIICMNHVSYHMYGSCLLSYVWVMSLIICTGHVSYHMYESCLLSYVCVMSLNICMSHVSYHSYRKWLSDWCFQCSKSQHVPWVNSPVWHESILRKKANKHARTSTRTYAQKPLALTSIKSERV